MSRPIIGITTSYNDGVQNVDYTYIRAIESAGGLPVIVPMLTDADAARQFSAMLDGLVMTGGPGIVKGLVGHLPDDLDPVDPVRDTADTLIYNTFNDRPVLGICYGMQFINAQAGGTLYGDLSRHIETSIQHSPKRGGTAHDVRIESDSCLASILGTDTMTVNTYHIQSLARVGDGLKAVAFGPDGVIEAVESEDGRLIGVQFHPERMGPEAVPLFRDFVARCR